MTAPKATESALRDHLVGWLGAPRRRAHTILVRAQPSWPGPPTLDIDGRVVHIVEGVSGLAALDAMRSAAEGEFIAVLTDLDEAALGTAVVLESEHQKVTPLDEWSGVPALFGARDTSVPRPVRELGSWVPRMLSLLRRDRGYPAAPGGNLSAGHVVRSILAALLGLERPEYLDIAGALTPLDDLTVRAHLTELDSDARNALIRAVGVHIDQHLAMALRAAVAPERVSVVAVGLVAAELWSGGSIPPDAATAAARVRAERYLGPSLSPIAAARFGAAAQLITRRWLASGDHHARDAFEQAEALCADLGWGEGAAASDFLPAGLRSRVQRFAETVEAAVTGSSVAVSRTVDAALEFIEAHGAKALFDRSLPTARMAARLVRWLASAEPTATGLDAAVCEYAADGAWAERALGDLWDGDSDRALATAYRSLAHAVQTRRRRADAAAARLLTGDAVASGEVMAVERLLADLVVPLSTRERVLLIVLDGMSAPTAVELGGELADTGWTELVRADHLRRGAALAALPTVTEYSRASLFAGELTAGNQQIERARFAAAVNGIVFHKDDLRSDAGYALPPAVADAIADPSRKIVAAVLNTIDDALANADVDALRWTLRSVANLEALLAAANAAGRLVILTSDHGHIVERGSELRSVADSSARWRVRTSGAVQADEIEVSGPRVLAPGGSAILAVSDGIRYASKKAGYHGGASLAELTIPILVLKPHGATDPAGWAEAPPQEPTWWNEPSRSELLVAQPVVAPRKSMTKHTQAPQPTMPMLFDTLPESDAAEPAPTGASLGSRLVGSSTYQARRSLAGRHPVEDSVVITIVDTLVAGGGRTHRDTLAVKLGIAAYAFGGVLTTLRRVLNVDGYPVLDVDADGVTVILDGSLLREQFELGRA